jgi:hypothetical protein
MECSMKTCGSVPNHFLSHRQMRIPMKPTGGTEVIATAVPLIATSVPGIATG